MALARYLRRRAILLKTFHGVIDSRRLWDDVNIRNLIDCVSWHWKSTLKNHSRLSRASASTEVRATIFFSLLYSSSLPRGLYILKTFEGGGGGGLRETVGLFENGPYLINCETHYRYQRRRRNRQGYAYLLPIRILDQVNDCLIGGFEGKSTWKWTKNGVQKPLRSRLISPHPYIAQAFKMFPKGHPRKMITSYFFF